MATYENSRYRVIARKYMSGCFVFDLLDKQTGKLTVSYSNNLKEAGAHADFYEAGK